MRTQASWLPALLLLAYGAAFAAHAIGAGVPAFDDHPGQLARLWHVVREGPAPWAWDPGWWAGYPEMQFYPPGWFYLGGVISWLTLHALEPPAIYTALVWLTYLAPGATAFLLLRRLLGDAWGALPGALVVLAFTGDPGGGGASGVEGGVHIGMAAARLAWAMLPLLAAALVGWIERGGAYPLAAVAIIAGIVLTHPAHGPAAIAMVVAAALVSRTRRRALAHAVGGVGIALALVAFWLLPLLVRLPYTRALAWGTFALPGLAHPFTAGLVALVVVALSRHASPACRAVLHAVWLALAIVALDALVLEPLGVRFLPADRVADGAWMTVLLAAGLGAGVVATAARRYVPVPAAALAVIALVSLLAIPDRALTLWPRPADWPTLAEVQRGLRLDDLAHVLRRVPPGRVLFIRSGVPLVFGTAWYRPHTHVSALTPVAVGREIIGGTFTHGAPVAALLYRGDAGRAPIDGLAEKLDGQSLFGRPLDALDAKTFDEYVGRFRVAAVVALEDDAPHLRFLADPARYHRISVPPFLVFTAVEAPHAPRRLGAATWEVVPGDEAPGGWSSTGVTYYPLWSAESAGRPVAVRRGAAGDLEVRTDAPTSEVRLTYEAATAELTGVAVSALAFVALVGEAWRRRRADASG